MRSLLLAISCYLLLGYSLSAQQIVLENGRIALCEGTLQDPGGLRNYSANESVLATLCADDPGKQLALTFTWSDIRAGDQLCIYDGEDDFAPELTCSTRWTGARLLVQATADNPSGCLTLSWQTDGSNHGQGFEAVVSCETVCQQILPFVTGSHPDSVQSFIDVCPGDLITLQAQASYPQNNIAYTQSMASTEFRWTLPDGRQRTGQTLQTAFAQPGGYTLELDAFDIRGCRNLASHRVRVRVAEAPRFSVSENLVTEVCAPNAVMLSLLTDNGVSGTTPTQYFEPTTSRTDSLPLPDGTGASHESSIIITQFAEGATVQNASDLAGICASMEHSWLRDLSIELVSPDGRVAVLHDHPGRFGGENFLGEPVEMDAGSTNPIAGIGYTYCWDNTDTKGDWLTYLNDNPQVVTLPAGTYRSFDPFDVFIGAPLNGAWTLRITDHWEADNGWIFEWNIKFDRNLPVAIDSFQTEIVDGFWWQDNIQTAYSWQQIAYANTVPGTLNPSLTLINSYGCRYDTTVTVTVLPASDASCEPCTAQIDTLPIQQINLGELVIFDLSTIGNAASRYQNAGLRTISHAKYPPTRPLRSNLSVNSPPVTRLSGDASELSSVCLSLVTSSANELSARLISPSGQSVMLADYNLPAVVSGTICFAAEVAADTLASFKPWLNLGGSTVAGDWQLELSDARGFSDSTYMHAWWLQFVRSDVTTVTATPAVTNLGDQIYEATPSQHTDYTFSYTDAAGCERSLIFPVDVRLPCQLSLKQLGFAEPSCEQEQDGEILVTAFGNQGPVVYALGSQRNSTGKFTDLAAGNYTVVATDSARCTTSLQVTLTATGGLQVTPNILVTNCDPLLYEVNLAISGPASVREAGYLDVASGDAISGGFRQNMSPGEYTYRTLDDGGCTVYHRIRLLAAEPIEVTAVPQSAACGEANAGSIDLNIQGGVAPYHISWDDGATGGQRAGLSAGEYAGSVEDALGCEVRFAVRLQEPATLKAIAEIEPNWCANETEGAVAVQVISGTGPYEIRADGGAWQAGTLVYGLSSGNHLIELRDAVRCTWQSDVLIETLSPLADSLAFDVSGAAYGEPLLIDAAENKHGAITRVQWRYSGANDLDCATCVQTTLTPYESGLLYAIVEDTLGCRVEGSAQIIVKNEPEVYVPTGFAPDGNSLENNSLRVHGRIGTVIESFVVFDRWGTQIYESSSFLVNAPSGWDGTYRGKPAPAGTYLYEVSARNRAGTVSRIRGSTTLLR